MEDKKRHGCVTAWLILMIVMNSLSALVNLFMGDQIAQTLNLESSSGLMVLSLIGVFNLVCAIQLLQWKKWAFWGFVGSTIVTFVANLAIGLPLSNSILGLIGFGVLFGILQIKRDGKSAWELLE